MALWALVLCITKTVYTSLEWATVGKKHNKSLKICKGQGSRSPIIGPVNSQKNQIVCKTYLWLFYISTAILPLPLIQEEQLSVTGERMCTKYW